MVMRPLFQRGDGGSTPTSPHKYKVFECRFEDISHIFKEFHYKGSHMGGSISICFALWDEFTIIGGAVVGKPRQEQAYSKGIKKVLEIRRMACVEQTAPNTESYFLAKILRSLKTKTMADEVISYADQSVGHKGTIYKAANFKLIGETAPSLHVFWNGVRYHPRSLTIERPYSHRLRAAVKTGEAILETGLPKLIYSYTL